MARILCTGGAGLIGSHLTDYMLNEGHDVAVVDNLSIGLAENVPVQAKFYVEDCQDLAAMDFVMNEFKPDVVYHLAAWAHEGLSQFMPVMITDNNYNAHISVLTAAIRNNVKRYVVGSSMSVYGNQEPPFNEEMPTRPEDIYAISKEAMEKSTKILADVHGMEYVILRPHNVYGPRQIMSDPYRNVVAIFINKCLKGEGFYIYGDGEQKRAFTYIDDAIPAIANAATYDVSGETINIGPTEEYTINQLAEEVLKHFDNIPDPEYLADRPKEVKNAWCTNDKAIKLLGFKTKTSFQEGVQKMVEWAKKNGSEETKYLHELEIEKNAPRTWVSRLI